MKKRFVMILLLILGLAALLRFPYISVFPPSMVQDEVGLGYTAISIAETGKDEWGNSYPMVFKSFGDYKPPAFFYVTALIYKLIGWHSALPRITSAIAGLFVVLFGAILVRKISRSDHLGLVAGFILAVSPWTIHLSRMALESNLGLAFFMAGLTLMYYSDNSKIKLFLSSILFGLSTYSYHGFRFTIILFFMGLLVTTIIINLFNHDKFLKHTKNIFLIFIFSTLFSLPGFLSKGSTSRLDQTLNVTSANSIHIYENYKNNCHITLIEINPKLTVYCKIKYNKFTEPVLIASNSFFKHLSPSFLFFNGDSDAGRNPTQQGEFFIVLFPFWIIGILHALKNFKMYYPILVGYLVTLLPSTFSGDPHAIRLSVNIPFSLVMIVIGYDYLRKKIKNLDKYFIIVLLIFAAVFSVTYAVDTYATNEKTATYLSFAKSIAHISYDYAQKGYIVYADHDLYPEPHIYYAYWNKINPKIAQESFSDFYLEGAGFSRPTKFGDKVHFEEGNIRALACDSTYHLKTVFITNDPIDFIPNEIVDDNTHTYKFAYVYDLDSIRLNKNAMLSLCNH